MRQQPLRDVHPDEARGSGNQYLLARHSRILASSRSIPILVTIAHPPPKAGCPGIKAGHDPAPGFTELSLFRNI